MIIYKFPGFVGSHFAKLWAFPAGEVGAALLPSNHAPAPTSIIVQASCRNSVEVMQLIMFLDAVRRKHGPSIKINLLLPYFPYARQDRVCNEGESLSVAVIAKMLNSFDLETVKLFDIHSSVATALFEHVVEIEVPPIFQQSAMVRKYDIVIAPDAGAIKRATAFAASIGVSEIAVANKQRDMSNGNIISYSLDKDVSGKRVAVVDDLCDGGATFEILANSIQEASIKDLYVSHGIFSKGTAGLMKTYDIIYTTNSYDPYLASESQLVVKRVFFDE